MAIEINTKRDENEICYEFQKAYLKIHDMEIKTAKEEVWIKFNIYADRASRDEEACSIKKGVIKVQLSDLDVAGFTKHALLTAGYNYLKNNHYTGIDV